MIISLDMHIYALSAVKIFEAYFQAVPQKPAEYLLSFFSAFLVLQLLLFLTPDFLISFGVWFCAWMIRSILILFSLSYLYLLRGVKDGGVEWVLH